LKENCHIMYTCSGLEFENVEKIHDGKFSMIIPTYASTVSSSNSIASQNRRKGVTLIKHNSKVGFEEQKYIEDLFNEFSYVKKFEEFNMDMENPFNYTRDLNNFSMNNDIEVSTIITSCAPAFIAILIEKLASIASMKSGIPKNEMEQMITKTVLATASLKDDYNLSNEEIISQVATKGGITQEGVDFLNKNMDRIYEKLIYQSISRFNEVKMELDEEYSKE
ncbi:MAG: pyrroline-5-carboxylate reductase dimerization domain-containing protein, partial [Methanobrevibacter sp.]|uniref:pyrroline-5-carboxylate reductase dimerization domain-containing protein n=1 Tax=Methanobrevibacter sp. TaxID=66852 RepID=UPI002E762125